MWERETFGDLKSRLYYLFGSIPSSPGPITNHHIPNTNNRPSPNNITWVWPRTFFIVLRKLQTDKSRFHDSNKIIFVRDKICGVSVHKLRFNNTFSFPVNCQAQGSPNWYLIHLDGTFTIMGIRQTVRQKDNRSNEAQMVDVN